MGDLNSTTGKYPDSVSQGNNIITNDQSEYALSFNQRNSFDNALNNHGKRLVEICRSANLRILNGRVSGDSLGRTTFYTGETEQASLITQYVTKISFQPSHILLLKSRHFFQIIAQL